MAQVLKDYDWSTRYSHRVTKYPWKEWMDGQTRCIKKEEDYTCQTTALTAYIRSRATRHGMKVHVSSPEGVDEIIFQFYKDEANE